MSREARLKISDARQAKEKERREEKKAAPLFSTFPSLSLEMRRAITDRDGKLCRSCGDAEPNLMVHSFLSGLNDLGALERDPDLHAVMCKFCRTVADDMGATNMATLLRTRW
jgi:hypothetical protein